MIRCGKKLGQSISPTDSSKKALSTSKAEKAESVMDQGFNDIVRAVRIMVRLGGQIPTSLIFLYSKEPLEVIPLIGMPATMELQKIFFTALGKSVAVETARDSSDSSKVAEGCVFVSEGLLLEKGENVLGKTTKSILIMAKNLEGKERAQVLSFVKEGVVYKELVSSQSFPPEFLAVGKWIAPKVMAQNFKNEFLYWVWKSYYEEVIAS